MKKIILIIAITIIFLQGCYTPATFQNAKLIPPKQIEISPHITANNPMTDHKTNFGVIVKYGLHEKKNLLFRYENIQVAESDTSGYDYFAIGGKIIWKKNKVTFTDFVGVYLDKGHIDGFFFEYKPSVNWTIYDNDNLELNLSANAPINFWPDDKNQNIHIFFGYVNLNFCPAFSTDFSKYSIRPLLGWCSYAWSGFDTSRFYQGISFSYKFELK